jgi:dolichol kinase
MVRLVRQSTRLERFAKALAAALFGQLRGSWRRRSALILALLLGFYAGNNVTAYLLWRMPGGRPAMVLATVLMLEVIVRLRGRWVSETPPLAWMLLDNLRIGLVYAVVLDAFKLGT